jgi:hypothetical protein
MKTIKGTIIVTLLISCYSFCHAQVQVQATPEQWKGVEKEMIRKSAYIFEGTVIQGKYYNGKKQQVWTDIVQITKIYKGSPKIKLGSIKIIVGQSGPKGNISMVSSGGGGASMSKNGTYIILGRLADSLWLVDSTKTDNNITVTSLGSTNYPVVIYGNKSAQWGQARYKTLDSLYSFFKENGLTVQEEALQK